MPAPLVVQDTCIRRVSIAKFPSSQRRHGRTASTPTQDLCAGCCTYTPARCTVTDRLEVFAGHLSSDADRTTDSHYGCAQGAWVTHHRVHG